MKVDFKLTKPHSKDCLLLERKDFYWCFSRTIFTNYNGNEKTKEGKWHFFLEFQCNDPQCQARAIVKNDWISNEIQQFIDLPRKPLIENKNFRKHF